MPSVPTKTDLLKFAVVRSPRLSAAVEGEARSFRIVPSAALLVLLKENDTRKLEAYATKLRNDLSGRVAGPIIVGGRLRNEIRRFEPLTMLTDEGLRELKGKYRVEGDLEALLSTLMDSYVAAEKLSLSEEQFRRFEHMRNVLALKRLADLSNVDGVRIQYLTDPLITVGKPAKPATTDKTSQYDEKADQCNLKEIILLMSAHLALQKLAEAGLLVPVASSEKSPKEKNSPAVAAAAAIGPESGSIISTVPYRLGIKKALDDAFPDDVLGYLESDFNLKDPSDLDVDELWPAITSSLGRRMRTLLAGMPSRIAVAIGRELETTVDAYTGGRIKDISSVVERIHRHQIRVKQHIANNSTIGVGSVKPIGIADLKLVRQTLVKYDHGEIAHIENVLQGETRGRKHTASEKVEQTFTLEQEESTSSEKDLQTTERFELSNELTKVLEERQKSEAGLKISARYGVVSVDANAGMSSEQSIQESAKVARSYAREAISKASERLEKRTKKTMTTVTTFETSEENRHEFSAQSSDVVGIYRWVEKHCLCQTMNYGARLMFEVLVPEPAAFYRYAQENRPSGESELRPPERIDFTPADITEWNYFALAGRYGASVSSPPPIIETAIVPAMQGKEEAKDEAVEVEIPKGYEVSAVSPIGAVRWIVNGHQAYSLLISPHLWSSSQAKWPTGWFYPPVRDRLEIAFNGVNVQHYAISVKLRLARTREALDAWKLATFSAINDAYQAQKGEYERKIAALKARRPSTTVRSSFEYREIERNELKRNCLMFITGQDFSSFDSVIHLPDAPPVVDLEDAESEGKLVKFFESSFEWDNIVYDFYPYFWGSADTWVSSFGAGDEDPVFQRFLRAGSSRVVVPVKRGLETQVLYYLETGQIWNGSDAPIVANPAYLALIEELQGLDADDQEEVAEGNPWRQVVPTSLVCLDGKPLPSWETSLTPHPGGFVPSEETCNGKPYNAAQWLPDRRAVVEALRTLGYKIDNQQDCKAYLSSPAGRRVVRAYQVRANELEISNEIGRPLTEDGDMGPCSLRVLSAALVALDQGKWIKPY